MLVERIGERRALVAAGALDAVACALALVAPSLWVLGVAVFLMGPTGAVFLLARQSYLTAAAPVALRARAMSTLGGVTRIGLFVGPLIGAPVVARWGPQAAFAVAVVAGLLAAALAWRTPDLGAHHEGLPGRARAGAGRTGSCAQNRRVLLTVGLGVLAIGLARSSRVVVVPLWAEHVGPRRRADLARLRRRRRSSRWCSSTRPAPSWTGTGGSGSPCRSRCCSAWGWSRCR